MAQAPQNEFAGCIANLSAPILGWQLGNDCFRECVLRLSHEIRLGEKLAIPSRFVCECMGFPKTNPSFEPLVKTACAHAKVPHAYLAFWPYWSPSLNWDRIAVPKTEFRPRNQNLRNISLFVHATVGKIQCVVKKTTVAKKPCKLRRFLEKPCADTLCLRDNVKAITLRHRIHPKH